MPSIRTVLIDDVEHWLGHVKDFTKDPLLSRFLSKEKELSIAWVRLEAGEQLDEHIHPVDSMIIICEGSAQTLGDIQDVMNAGDTLIVPRSRPHGFIGMQPHGFWGLSIQFEPRGIYQDSETPLAAFLADEQAQEKFDRLIIEQLFKKNEEYLEKFDKHRLFTLARDGLFSNPTVRIKFLDYFQVWSNFFQKMVLTRVITTQNPIFEELAWQHLLEELGHNRELLKERGNDSRDVFDPVLEATCAWFPWKTTLISDVEKIVLVHLVVEASATIFYKHLQPIMGSKNAKSHFESHNIIDHSHVEMGYSTLKELHVNDLEPLFEIQKQGWDMLMAVMGRIADLSCHYSKYTEVKSEGKEHSNYNDASLALV